MQTQQKQQQQTHNSLDFSFFNRFAIFSYLQLLEHMVVHTDISVQFYSSSGCGPVGW